MPTGKTGREFLGEALALSYDDVEEKNTKMDEMTGSGSGGQLKG